MNLRYKDNMLEVLPLLERGRAMTLPQLISLHSAAMSERTLQRYIKEFRELHKLDLSGTQRGYVALPDIGYIEGLSRFLRAYFLERSYPPVHGEVSDKLIAAALTAHQRPAQVMFEMLRAIREFRSLNFMYKPQHPQTRQKLAATKIRFGATIVSEGYMPVSMVPCGFSFGGDLMLLVGEAIFAEGKRERRQYAIRGMLNAQCGLPENLQLEFNFSKVYADSVYTWIGGIAYELIIEDSRFDETPHVYALRANGEEEALVFASSALGRVKIVDPPVALVAKARELKLDAKNLFRFTA